MNITDIIEKNSNYLLESFIDFVKIETTSDENSTLKPSTQKQQDFLAYLKKIIDNYKIGESVLHEKGYLTLKIKSNTEDSLPSIGFLSHVDTSPEVSGKNVKPVIKKVDDDLIISSDGKTLLGADDKGGVAVMATLVKILAETSELKHGDIYLMWTTDEEVGRGVEDYPADFFSPDFAFTLDGGELGEIEFECFNASTIKVDIKGRSIHLGSAKNRLINALDIAAEFVCMLPKKEKPESTDGRDGYYACVDLKGEIEKASITFMLRDFDKNRLKEREKFIADSADILKRKYLGVNIDLNIKESYSNMRQYIPVDVEKMLKNALKLSHVIIKEKIIRGGTDGARLSELGIPTPNIFVGGKNFHSVDEEISFFAMKKSLEVVINLLIFL